MTYLLLCKTPDGGGGDGVARGYILVEDPKTLDISGWEVLDNARSAVTGSAGYKVNIKRGTKRAPVSGQHL